MTAPLAVDPSALAGIGGTVGGDGESVAAAVGSLSSALSGAGAMFGHDAAGLVFGQSYTASGKALLDAAAAAVNACRRVGFGVQMSASNYGRANARSTVGGGASPVPVPTDPAQFSAPTMPPPLGGGIAAPLGWTLVEAFVGDVWPDGNPGQMHAAAAAWRTFGAAMSGLAAEVGTAGPGLGSQQIPEAGQMSAAVGQISAGLTDIATQAQSLATAVDGFAETVDATQNAVRGLLHQLSPGGVLETIGGIFTGHDPMEKVREIAREIKTVLNNMKREADASSQIFSQGINLLDSATNSLENWAHKEFTESFGQDVGDALSFGFNGLVDLPEGGLKFIAQTAASLHQLDPTRFAYDPEGAAKNWGGMLETTAELTNPVLLAGKIATDPQGSLNTLKGLVDYQDFADGHPFRALGYDSAQVGALLIPGVGEAEPAIAGAEVETRAAATEVEAEQQAAASAAREGAPVASGATSATESVTTQAGRIGGDLNNIKVPESSAPTAGPGASVPGGRAPIDTAPPVEAPRPETPAPHAAEPPLRAPEASAPSGSGYGDVPRPAGAPDSYAEPPSTTPSASMPNDPAPGAPQVGPAGAASDGLSNVGVGEHVPAAAPPGDLAPIGGEHSVDAAASAGADDRVPVGAHSSGAGEGAADGLGSGSDHEGSPGSGHGGDGSHDGAAQSPHDSPGSHDATPPGDHGPSHHPSTPHPLPPDSPLFDGYHPVDPGPEFTNPDGSLRYPDDSLPDKPYAVPGTVVPDAQLHAGTVLGRFGYPGGAWLAPEATPFADLALPPESALKPYYEYMVADPANLPRGYHIELSQVAPWFHQPGGGIQYRIIGPDGKSAAVQALIDSGYLKYLGR